MKKRSALALGIGASMGIAVLVAAAGPRPNSEIAVDMARGIVGGVILGSHAWSYNWNVPAADYQSRLQLWSSLCGWQGQCDGYGLATVGAGYSDQEPAEKTDDATPPIRP
jgi:hypothetical protein